MKLDSGDHAVFASLFLFIGIFPALLSLKNSVDYPHVLFLLAPTFSSIFFALATYQGLMAIIVAIKESKQ